MTFLAPISGNGSGPWWDRDQRVCFFDIVVAIRSDDIGIDPMLVVIVDGQQVPVQTSHITHASLLDFPEWKYSIWRFMGSTREDIDIFHLDTKRDIYEMINVETRIDSSDRWITPVPFPYER